MKNKCFFVSVFLFVIPTVFAATAKMKFDVGCFQPAQRQVRSIFSAGPTYKLELDIRTINELYVFAMGDYFFKKGESIGENDECKLRILGASAGLEYAFKMPKNIYFFIGLGPKYVSFKTHDSIEFIRKTNVKTGVGGIAKVGFEWRISSSLLLEIYSDYTYKRLYFKSHPDKGSYYTRNIQAGGFSAGGGIGFVF